MSSINAFPTFQYSQPEEYRFSHDSVFLARQVYEHFQNQDLSQLKVLDVCSGCGIIGLDFIYHSLSADNVPASVDFMEVQDIYQQHFAINQERLSAPKVKTSLLIENYDVLQKPEFSHRYDLILSNPPYFNVQQGTLSPSEFKNRCRFFIDSDLGSLVRGVENALVPGGQAFILLRSRKDYGQDVFKIVSDHLQASSLKSSFQIRGTDVGLIQKNS